MSDATWNQSGAAGGSESQPSSQPSEQAVPGPGEQLAAYREAHSWTIEQVASQLNLAPRQVQAIEDNNYAALPGRAVTRGFIRAYAKLLKVDADPLVALMPTEKVEVSPEEPNTPPIRRAIPAQFSYNTRMPPMRKGSSFLRRMVVGIFVIVVVGGGIAAYQMGLIPIGTNLSLSKTSAAISPASSEQANVQPEAVKTENMKPEEPSPVVTAPPGAPTVAQPNAEAPKNDISKAKNGANKAIADAHPAAVPGATSLSETSATPQNSEAPASKGALVLKAREDSWVEVRRTGTAAGAKNSVLVSHMVKAGSTETFDVTGPVSVTIGNAAGVDVLFRGEPMNLKSNTKTNVARLNLK